MECKNALKRCFMKCVKKNKVRNGAITVQF
jgi:hypothetical protein